jgi:hypothetical protein
MLPGPSERYVPVVVLVRTRTYTYVPVHTCMYWYILIQNGFRWTAEEIKKVIDMLCRPFVREIMEDPIFKGNQNYKFEMDPDKAGKRLYGGEANAGVAFQIGQLRYIFSKYKLVCASMYRPMEDAEVLQLY